MNPWARRATCPMRRSFLLASLLISLLLNSGWTDLILARARASLATSDSGVSDSPRPWWRRLRSRPQSTLCPRKLMRGVMLELWRHQEPQPQPLATLRAVTWLRDLMPGKPLLGSVSRELYAICSQPQSVCTGGNQPVCPLLVVIGLSDLHKVTPSVHCAHWSLGIRTLSPSLARWTSTPWTEVSGSGRGPVPLLRVLSGRLGSRLPQARAPVLGVRFSSAWCCAPSENHVPLHPPDPATSLGSYVGHGFMCAAPGLMQCPPFLGPCDHILTA